MQEQLFNVGCSKRNQTLTLDCFFTEDVTSSGAQIYSICLCSSDFTSGSGIMAPLTRGLTVVIFSHKQKHILVFWTVISQFSTFHNIRSLVVSSNMCQTHMGTQTLGLVPVKRGRRAEDKQRGSHSSNESTN